MFNKDIAKLKKVTAIFLFNKPACLYYLFSINPAILFIGLFFTLNCNSYLYQYYFYLLIKKGNTSFIINIDNIIETTLIFGIS